MKHLIILCVVSLCLLSGCTEVRYAKANEIRASTQRKNDLHNNRVRESNMLAPDRIAAKKVFIWSATGSGIIMLAVMTVAGSYYVIGMAKTKVNHSEFMQVPMDPITRQFPIIIYRGNRAYLPNTGERLCLDDTHDPYPDLAAIAGKVQLAGVIASSGYKPDNRLIEVL